MTQGGILTMEGNNSRIPDLVCVCGNKFVLGKYLSVLARQI